jgi:hypothetical protein
LVISLSDLELYECILLSLPIVEREEVTFGDVVEGDKEEDDDDNRYDEIDRVLPGIIMFATKLVLITPGSKYYANSVWFYLIS